MSNAEVGGTECARIAALVGTSSASSVLYAEVGATTSPGAVRTSIVSTFMASTVLFAEVGGTDCALRTAIVSASTPSTVL